MKWSKWSIPFVFTACLFTLTACGNGGGGGGGDNAPPTVNALNLAITTLTGFLNEAFSAGVAVNGPGMTVGVADNGTTLQAVSWDTSATAPTPTALKSLNGGVEYCAAYAVNDNDVIVGESSDGIRPVAVFWPAASTTPTSLPLTGLFPGGTSAAYGISVNGEIVGEADADLAGKTVGVYWSGSTAEPVILENLAGTQQAFSAAYDINDFQVIIGESLSDDGNIVPVVWIPDDTGTFGAPVALPLLPGHVEGVALDLNNSDEIAGESHAADGTVHGVVWTISAGGTALDIKDLGPSTSVGAINNNKLLGGYVNAGSGNDAATLWNGTDVIDTKEVSAAFSQAYGLNDSNWAVGAVNGQGFVAKPQ